MSVPNKHGGASTSLYFKDNELLVRVEELAKVCELSTSELVERLLACCIEELELKAPKQRIFTSSLTVKL